MNNIEVKVNAKINLSLNVTDVSDNGYHYLDMVVASVDLADAITICPRRDKQITCRFEYSPDLKISDSKIPEDDNTAIRAAQLIMSKFGISGIDISILKGIPLSGGLGGSSADAAGVMLALGLLFNLDIKSAEMLNIASKCGSDVMLQLENGFKRVKGTGEQVEILNGIPQYNLVIVKGAGGVNAKDSYRIFDEQNELIINNKKSAEIQNTALIKALQNRDFYAIADNMHNDLYAPSLTLNPSIADTVKMIKDTNPKAVLMSGSGSSCFGIYADKAAADAAADVLFPKFEFVKSTVTK